VTPRPHDYCHECGGDLGERPPEPRRCRHCHRPVKGHVGPVGVGRCRATPEVIKVGAFLESTIKAYAAELDKAYYAEGSGMIGLVGAAYPTVRCEE